MTAVYPLAQVRPGEGVMVTGASGAVGATAVQLVGRARAEVVGIVGGTVLRDASPSSSHAAGQRASATPQPVNSPSIKRSSTSSTSHRLVEAWRSTWAERWCPRGPAAR